MQGIAQKVLAEPGKYSLQQLQQAVQSGSLPAYIGIPLIQEKLRQQKQMQGMAQAQAPQGPSVAEQVMQEAQGVQALPSNLPQEYAGGGIVAFDGGGEVPRYSTGGALDAARARAQAAQQKLYTYGLRQQRQDPAGFQAAQQELAAAQAALQAAERGYQAEMSAAGVNRPAFGPPTAAGPMAAQSQPPAPAGGTPAPAGSTPPAPARRPPGDAPARRPPGDATAQRPPGEGNVPLTAGTKPTLAAPEGPSFAEAAKDYFRDFNVQARNIDVEAEAKKREARGRLQGQAFDEYKNSLEREARQAGAEGAQAKNMALFKAGLAMMAGTSRHALENIGKGALLGAEDYQAATKDLKKAERERRRELAHIEQARRAEAIGDRDTAIREIDAARDRHETRARYVGEGIYKATGMDRAQAFEIAKAQFAADTDIYGKHIAGGYQLAAAKERARDTGVRGAVTPAQLMNARMRAMGQVDEAQIRAQVAKQANLSKVPKPGEDATFDRRVTTAYDQAINAIVNRALGLGGAGSGGGGDPFQGFRIVPE